MACSVPVLGLVLPLREENIMQMMGFLNGKMTVGVRNVHHNIYYTRCVDVNMHIEPIDALNMVIDEIPCGLLVKVELYIQGYNENGYPDDNRFRSLAVL